MHNQLNHVHQDWIEARGLDLEHVERFGLRTVSGGIAIPYRINGQQPYAKVFRVPRRDSDPKAFCQPNGATQNRLWNEECLRGAVSPDAILVITEGEWDALACLQVGQQHVVSLPSGANSIEAALCRKDDSGKLWLRDELAKFRRFLVFTDCDAAGIEARDRIIKLIGADYCYVPTYPDGAKDANDILRDHGALALHDVVERCRPAKSDGFIALTEARSHPRPPVLEFGLPFLAPLIKLSKPEFLVIGGQSGHGKSTIQQLLLFHLLMENQNLKASIFHGEGHLSIVAKRATTFWRYQMPGMSDRTGDPEIQTRRDRWLDERLAFISPPQDTPPTFEWLLWAMERHALHRKRDVFVVDPWNEILHRRDMRQNNTDYIGECIIKMKNLADRLGLILIITHHIAKPRDAKAPPNRYDLADSAHWVNKADHVLLCWKPFEGQNKTRVEIAKSRDHDLLGRPGSVWVQLNAPQFSLYQTEVPEGISVDRG